eukprot:3019255-Alexandrium_andersonii.AAC.1
MAHGTPAGLLFSGHSPGRVPAAAARSTPSHGLLPGREALSCGPGEKPLRRGGVPSEGGQAATWGLPPSRKWQDFDEAVELEPGQAGHVLDDVAPVLHEAMPDPDPMGIPVLAVAHCEG